MEHHATLLHRCFSVRFLTRVRQFPASEQMFSLGLWVYIGWSTRWGARWTSRRTFQPLLNCKVRAGTEFAAGWRWSRWEHGVLGPVVGSRLELLAARFETKGTSVLISPRNSCYTKGEERVGVLSAHWRPTGSIQCDTLAKKNGSHLSLFTLLEPPLEPFGNPKTQLFCLQ